MMDSCFKKEFQSPAQQFQTYDVRDYVCSVFKVSRCKSAAVSRFRCKLLCTEVKGKGKRHEGIGGVEV
jgi:hypothetical protein